jgi:hypothetical protein
MTYSEALHVAQKMGWTKTNSWKTGAGTGRRGYSVNFVREDSKLRRLLEPFRMRPKRWKDKVIEVARNR